MQDDKSGKETTQTKGIEEYALAGIENVRLDAIPASLKARPHWIAWKAIPQEGKKPKKVPINPATGGQAMSNNPSTWGDFSQAVDRCRRDKLAGIGLMFSDDGLVGVDLDDVMQDGKFTNFLAEAVVRGLDSYAEVSPSGKGVKVWLTATDKPTRTTGTIRQTAGGMTEEVEYETYCRGRWFAVTGHALPNGDGKVQERSTQYAKMLAMGQAPKAKRAAATPPAATAAMPATVDAQRDEDLARCALRYWDAESESRWFRAGCCLKAWGASEGVGDARAKALWDEWSSAKEGRRRAWRRPASGAGSTSSETPTGFRAPDSGQGNQGPW